MNARRPLQAWGCAALVAVACAPPATESSPASPAGPEVVREPIGEERGQPLRLEGREAPAAGTPPTPSGRFELVALPVPGFLDAVLALPEGSAPLPVVLATHGAGGEPEWTCNEWGSRMRGEAIVLCPRGKAISARDPYGFFYPDHIALEKEVLACVGALEAALGDRVVRGPRLYTGYSQGATMGALFVIDHASSFPSLVLTEGGFSSFSAASARQFRAGGGRRVLFVCGGAGCRDSAHRSAALLEAASVEARVEYVPGGGHTDGGRVGERLTQTYRWAWEAARE